MAGSSRHSCSKLASIRIPSLVAKPETSPEILSQCSVLPVGMEIESVMHRTTTEYVLQMSISHITSCGSKGGGNGGD